MVRVHERAVVVDFAGTDGQSPSGINCPATYTRAYSVYAVRCVVSPQLPNNHGSIAPITVTAPEGCILNPRPPAATGARHMTGWHAPVAIWNALAQAVPERVIAEPGLPSSCTVSGFDHAQRPFVAITVIGGGGTGARPDSDGLDSTGIPTVTSHVSVEVLESTSPLLVEELTLLPDSGGAGRFRGGLGARYRIRSLAPEPLQVAIIGNKFRFPAQGLHGGHPGRPRRAYLNGKEVNPLGRYQLPPGGTLIMVNGGGGGFFSPTKRELSTVVEDVRNEFVTSQAAKRYYHVMVDRHTWTGRRREEPAPRGKGRRRG
jgi:N-methylhydantoinase B